MLVSADIGILSVSIVDASATEATSASSFQIEPRLARFEPSDSKPPRWTGIQRDLHALTVVRRDGVSLAMPSYARSLGLRTLPLAPRRTPDCSRLGDVRAALVQQPQIRRSALRSSSRQARSGGTTGRRPKPPSCSPALADRCVNQVHALIESGCLCRCRIRHALSIQGSVLRDSAAFPVRLPKQSHELVASAVCRLLQVVTAARRPRSRFVS
jgi:hypothetical protein